MRTYCFGPNPQRNSKQPRRGAFAILAMIALTLIMAFAALSVDYSRLTLTRQRMQNACDAAALAAAMEISHAVESAGPEVADVFEYAKQMARNKAAEVGELLGVYVNPERDVAFGRRSYNSSTGTFQITWGGSIINLVKVTARRDNADPVAPDARIPIPFASAIGAQSHGIVANAAAYVEARDIVCVLDFSRSMNFDSYFADEATTSLSQTQIEANLQMIWIDLGSPTYGNLPFNPGWVTIPSSTWGASVLNVRWQDKSVYVACSSSMQRVRLTFSGGAQQTFTNSTQSGTWQGTGSNANKTITKCEIRRGSTTWETFDFYNDSHISRGLGLSSVPYPWPSGSWANYYDMVRDTSGSFYQSKLDPAGYRRKFGIMTLLQYVLRFENSYAETPDLWKTRHYPFHCLKEGQELLCDFLQDLSYNDYVGIVSYDTNHRIEKTLSGPGMPTVNISSQPVTNNYQAVKNLIHYKQAGHYSSSTNIGGGLKSAKQLLDQYGRPEARPTILLMTDGNSNTIDAGESTSLPAGWNWAALFDYDNDGDADYTTNDTQKRYVLKKAKECVEAGYTIHTLSMGADADRNLMEAIAFMGGGVYLDVPGGTSVSQMENDVKEAFNKIASFVPPATLLDPNQ